MILFRYILLLILVSLPLGAYAEQKLLPGEYIATGRRGSLEIKAGKGNHLSFEINTFSDRGNVCFLEGDIVEGQSVLEGVEKDEPCIVKFAATDRGIEVSDNNGTCGYCGVGAYFTFLYLKSRPDCEAKAVKRTRSDFKRLYDRNEYAQAKAKLEPLLNNCADMLHVSEDGWIRNDLAITLYKLGDSRGCLSLLQPLAADAMVSDAALEEQYPYGNADTVIPIARATRTNLRLCSGEKVKKAGKPRQ